MKKRILFGVIGLAALVCTLAMVTNATTTTNSCLKFLWTGPMGPENIQGQVEVTFYTAHTWEDCDCAHDPGTISLKWRYAGLTWSNWITMDEYSIVLCKATCYSCSFFVNHQSTIEVYVEDSADTTNCHIAMPGWRVP